MSDWRTAPQRDAQSVGARRGLTMAVTFVAVAVPGWLLASDVTIPHIFSPGDPVDAAKMNANFSALSSAVNDNDSRLDALEQAGGRVVWVDKNGAVAGDVFGVEGLVSLTPTLSRQLYVGPDGAIWQINTNTGTISAVGATPIGGAQYTLFSTHDCTGTEYIFGGSYVPRVTWLHSDSGTVRYFSDLPGPVVVDFCSSRHGGSTCTDYGAACNEDVDAIPLATALVATTPSPPYVFPLHLELR